MTTSVHSSSQPQALPKSKTPSPRLRGVKTKPLPGASPQTEDEAATLAWQIAQLKLDTQQLLGTRSDWHEWMEETVAACFECLLEAESAMSESEKRMREELW